MHLQTTKSKAICDCLVHIYGSVENITRLYVVPKQYFGLEQDTQLVSFLWTSLDYMFFLSITLGTRSLSAFYTQIMGISE